MEKLNNKVAVSTARNEETRSAERLYSNVAAGQLLDALTTYIILHGNADDLMQAAKSRAADYR